MTIIKLFPAITALLFLSSFASGQDVFVKNGDFSTDSLIDAGANNLDLSTAPLASGILEATTTFLISATALRGTTQMVVQMLSV